MIANPLPDLAHASTLLRTRQLSAVELTRQALNRIDAVDSKVKAFLTVCGDGALAQAREADARLAASTAGPLTGIPMALKDVLITQGVRTTAGSRMLEHFVPPYDGHVNELLRAAGAVMVGKVNCDEFAMGSSTDNSAYGPVHNPWDLTCVPGGSSGGSSAAVAAGEVIFSLGSDTGGSIRQPAALSGVVGMKPTYGRVSRYGLIAFASSLDQIGPFTRTCADMAVVLQAIAGHDQRDSTSADVPVPNYSALLNQTDLRGLRLGVPKELFVDGMQPEVERTIRASIAKLVELGAEEREVSLPHAGYALPAYYIIAPAEASANLARFDGVKYGYRSHSGDSMWDQFSRTRGEGFGPEVKRRIMLGTYALSAGYFDAYYLQAQKVRTLVRRDFELAFAECDALVAPTTPTVAFKIGEKANDPVAMYLNDVCTIPVNLAGLPGLVVPCGLAGGLPVGVQLIGKAWSEDLLLRIGNTLELALGSLGLPVLD